MKGKTIFVILIFFGNVLFATEKVRQYWNNIGYCKTPEQIEKIVDLSLELEQKLLEEEKDRLKDKTVIAAICPHDEHLYSGRSYIHSIVNIARVKTVIIIGLAYTNPNPALKNAENLLVFDNFDEWFAPYSPVKVDVELRKYLKSNLDKNVYIESNILHTLEYSIESQLAFLKYYNKEIKILPILITAMDFDSLYKMSVHLSGVIVSYLREHELKLGKDLAFLIATDLTHYSSGYFNNPFAYGDEGIDEEAHEKGIEQDINFGKKFFSDTVSEEKIKEFTEENTNWSGGNAVSFGLLTAKKVVNKIDNKSLNGFPLKYLDNYSEGALPAYKMGIGVSNPISLQQWVGYWSIVFYKENN